MSRFLSLIHRATRYARRRWLGLCSARSKHRYILSELAMLTGVDLPHASFRTADGSLVRLHAEGIPLGLWQGTYEDRASVRACTDFLRPGDIAIDIGANIGHFTVAMGNRVGPTGRVFSIEPNPRVFRRLQENVRLNRLCNVRCVRVAMCSDDGAIARFYAPARASDTGALSAGAARTRRGEFDVTCRSGERLLSELNLTGRPLALMKIDVEGHEIDVLKGFGTALAQFDCIMFEQELDNIRAAGHLPRETFQILGEHGYRIYACDPDAGVARRQRSEMVAGDLLAVRNAGEFAARTGYRLVER